MPVPQVASVSNFTFGATGTGNPAAGNEVLKFKLDIPGRYNFTITNYGDSAMTISFLSSADDTTYNALTTAKNLVAITNVSVAARATVNYEVLLTRTTDAFLSIRATGGVRGQVQVRPDSGLIPMNLAA